jgi:hypothetical protein
MTIEIEVPSSTLFKLFESHEIPSGTVHEIPGGASIQLGRVTEHRYAPGVEFLVPIVITIGSEIAVGLAVNYLWDKLKDEKKKSWVRISREEKIEITPASITKTIKESIELGEK